MNNFNIKQQTNNIEQIQNNSDFIPNVIQSPNVNYNNNKNYNNHEGIFLQSNINYPNQSHNSYYTKLEFFLRKWVFFGILFFGILTIITIIILCVVNKKSRLFFIILLIIFIITIVIFLLIPYTIIVSYDERNKIIKVYKQNIIRCSSNKCYITIKISNIKFFRITKNISTCHEDYLIHVSFMIGGERVLFVVGKDNKNVDFELDIKKKIMQMNAWLGR